MSGETIYNLKIEHSEVMAVKSLLDILDNCPIPLTNDNYISIFRAISHRDNDVENIEGLKIIYNEEKKSTSMPEYENVYGHLVPKKDISNYDNAVFNGEYD